MFYVYMLTDPRKNDQPFYIGKGQGKRAFVHATENCKYNRFKNNIIDAIRKKGLEHGVIILREFTDEQEAFNFEIETIAKYGRRKLDEGGILANRTLGGEGSTGYKFTEDQRKNISSSRIGAKDSDDTRKKKSESAKKPKSAEHAKNISKSKTGEKNPMYGKDSPFKGKRHTEESKEKIKKARSKQIISEETKQKMAESQRKRHALRRLSIEEFLK